MAWITEDRRNTVVEKGTTYLSDDMKIDIANKYFPRYPNKRACLLPVLHAVQHAHGFLIQPVDDAIGSARRRKHADEKAALIAKRLYPLDKNSMGYPGWRQTQ